MYMLMHEIPVAHQIQLRLTLPSSKTWRKLLHFSTLTHPPLSIAEILLDHGADVNFSNSSGKNRYVSKATFTRWEV